MRAASEGDELLPPDFRRSVLDSSATFEEHGEVGSGYAIGL